VITPPHPLTPGPLLRPRPRELEAFLEGATRQLRIGPDRRYRTVARRPLTLLHYLSVAEGVIARLEALCRETLPCTHRHRRLLGFFLRMIQWPESGTNALFYLVWRQNS